jgi:dTMP kinase
LSSSAPAAARRGTFITLEGGEGAGKTTQARHIAERLRARGLAALITREPGGSPNAEILRNVLLSGKLKALGGTAEAIVFAAARIDHIDHTIAPALAAGTWVICDRFADSTRAYQGTAGGVDPGVLRLLESVTLNGLQPDLTLILDLPPDIGLARAAARRVPQMPLDRFESEAIGFHEALRQAYLAIAAAEPERCVIVNAARDEAVVAAAIWDAISSRLLSKEEPLPTGAPMQDLRTAPIALLTLVPQAIQPTETRAEIEETGEGQEQEQVQVQEPHMGAGAEDVQEIQEIPEISEFQATQEVHVAQETHEVEELHVIGATEEIQELTEMNAASESQEMPDPAATPDAPPATTEIAETPFIP